MRGPTSFPSFGPSGDNASLPFAGTGRSCGAFRRKRSSAGPGGRVPTHRRQHPRQGGIGPDPLPEHRLSGQEPPPVALPSDAFHRPPGNGVRSRRARGHLAQGHPVPWPVTAGRTGGVSATDRRKRARGRPAGPRPDPGAPKHHCHGKGRHRRNSQPGRDRNGAIRPPECRWPERERQYQRSASGAKRVGCWPTGAMMPIGSERR